MTRFYSEVTWASWCHMVKNHRTFNCLFHDDVIKWNIFRVTGPLTGEHTWRRGIPRSPVESPHKCQLRIALMFSLIYASINRRANDGDAGDLRRHRAHYDATAMYHPLQANVKENIKAPHYWPFVRETTGGRLIPLTKGQSYGIHFHVMASSW